MMFFMTIITGNSQWKYINFKIIKNFFSPINKVY